MSPLSRVSLAALLVVGVSLAVQAQDGAQSQLPPKTWVDKDTGHRVWRVSDEPNSGAFYFNVNAFTPDHKSMVYNSPDGIRVLDLATMTTKMLVPNPPRPAADAADAGGARGFFGGGARAIVVGHKTNSVFFTKTDPATRVSSVY